MAEHNTSAYRDGNKWILYCMNCGLEESALTATSCDERYVANKYVDKKLDKAKESK